jgi:hypothetical protein
MIQNFIKDELLVQDGKKALNLLNVTKYVLELINILYLFFSNEKLKNSNF